MKKIAIIDVDETLWDFSNALYSVVRQRGYKFPPPIRWTRWNIFWDYLSKEEMFPIFDEVHSNQCKYKPFPDAKKFLNYLSNDYYIIIASHRNPKFKKELIKWLKMNDLHYDKVDVSYDKTKLFKDPRVSIVIDDRDETLNIAIDHNIRAMGLQRPWNINGIKQKCKLFPTLTSIKDYLSEGDGDDN